MSMDYSLDRSSKLKWKLVGILGKWIIDALFFSCRIRIRGYEAVRPILTTRPFILAFWHSRILMVSYLFKGWNAAIMVSASKDGEYIAQVLGRQGHDSRAGFQHTPRGSGIAGNCKKNAERTACRDSPGRPSGTQAGFAARRYFHCQKNERPHHSCHLFSHKQKGVPQLGPLYPA